MPLTSFHCPDNPFRLADMAACEACEDRCTPIEVVRLVWRVMFEDDRDHYHHDPKVISVTEAMSGACLRRAWYNRHRDYAETPQRLLSRTQGTLLHRELEKANNDTFSEVVVSCTLTRGYTLAGTSDRLSSNWVWDFKKSKTARKTADYRQMRQVNIYGQMQARAGGALPQEMGIIFIAHDAVNVVEAEEMPEALDDCLERCEVLIDRLEDGRVELLPREGLEIKNFRTPICTNCPHLDECEATPEVDDGD